MTNNVPRVFLIVVLGLAVLTDPSYRADRRVVRPAVPGEQPAQSSAPRLGGILSPGILTGIRRDLKPR